MHTFISYVHDDILIVQRLAEYLRANAIEVWLDREKLAPGKKWQDVIRKAIRSGSYFIACFSDNYLTRSNNYMEEELNIALEELKLRPTETDWFIPVIINRYSFPELPKRIAAVIHETQVAYLVWNNFEIGGRKIRDTISPDAKFADIASDVLAFRHIDWPNPSEANKAIRAIVTLDQSIENQIYLYDLIHREVPPIREYLKRYLIDEEPNESLILFLAIVCYPETVLDHFIEFKVKLQNCISNFPKGYIAFPYFGWSKTGFCNSVTKNLLMDVGREKLIVYIGEYIKEYSPTENFTRIVAKICEPNSILEMFPSNSNKFIQCLETISPDYMSIPYFAWNMECATYKNMFSNWKSQLGDQAVVMTSIDFQSFEICPNCQIKAVMSSSEDLKWDGEYFRRTYFFCTNCKDSWEQEDG
ncbi:MAG: toll/interleukin-1 receptor domain-containing protein [bacterium]|nr:toll/interleukin-1 receptor domain-containing protein [bacterium]